MRQRALLLSLFGLAACTDSYTPGSMYLATTADCRNWVEGSRFDLPQQISVSAASPVALGTDAQGRPLVELPFAYILPRATEAMFSSKGFHITQPHGALALAGSVAMVDRRAMNLAAGKAELLDGLPALLRADATGDQTLYRVNVRFAGALPDRFDLTPPAMKIGGTTYPVRTYTYRFFKERNAYGLCS